MMKHVYIDTAMIISSKDTKPYKDMLELVLELIKRQRISVILLCSDPRYGAFRLVDKERFLAFYAEGEGTKGQLLTEKLIGFHELHAGAVFWDIDSEQCFRPAGNYLYPVLRRSGVRIVSSVCGVLPVTHPQDHSEEEVMRCIGNLGAAILHSHTAVFENETAQTEFSALCAQTGAECPYCAVISHGSDNAPEWEKLFLSLYGEEETVRTNSIKQMVVLTARNDDVMKSLPFIEAYMPFIKELVVCCPERNVQPFREKYNGRLSLTFITDDELLKGRDLPADHQARNFFLRCLLMEQDRLDDVFIMTDDDYRPLKPLTEEVFIKDGRYRAYYFYDLRKWQGTYNNYTSFDKGAFKTRDFLIRQGYPTLQYSSHQPQIIDKGIFREMLKTHDGIENNPYDEWSTYFNFALYHHPDRFEPCRNVSMCWPADTASWELYHEPDEFLFENYYEELYEDGGIFAGFSKEFCADNIQAENDRKADICRKLIKKHLGEQAVFKEYCREYSKEKGVYPSVIIAANDKTDGLCIGMLRYIKLPADCWMRIPVAIERDVYAKYNGKTLYISYHFLNSCGVPFLNSPEIPIKTGDTRLMLPVRLPRSQNTDMSLMIKTAVKDSNDNNISAQTDGIASLKLI